MLLARGNSPTPTTAVLKGVGLPLPMPGIGAPDGAGGRPGTLFGARVGVSAVDPGGGGAPAGGFALVDAPVDDPPPSPVCDRLTLGGLTRVGDFIPAPSRRSFEMGAGRFGAGFSSSSPLMKAPRANVKVLSFFLRFSSSMRSASDGFEVKQRRGGRRERGGIIRGRGAR